MLGRFDFLFREGAPQLVLVVRQDLVQTVDVESGLPQERLQNLTDSPATFHLLPFVREIGVSRGNCVVVIPVTGGLQQLFELGEIELGHRFIPLFAREHSSSNER